MYSRHRALPLIQRTELRALLHVELIAALARCPVATARRYVDAWLDTVAFVAAMRRPIVFDWFVAGPPAPMLLEIAHELRLVRQAEHDGVFADEEEQWYEQHGDDAEPWRPPRPDERVVATLGARSGFGPMVTESDVVTMVVRTMRTPRDEIMDLVQVSMAVDRLIGEVADSARIGDLVIADARLPHERQRRWGWAA